MYVSWKSYKPQTPTKHQLIEKHNNLKDITKGKKKQSTKKKQSSEQYSNMTLMELSFGEFKISVIDALL